MALAGKENARHKLDELQRGFRPEEIAMSEAKYRQAQATLEKFQRGNRREDVAAANAELAYEEARYRNARSSLPAKPLWKSSTSVRAI